MGEEPLLANNTFKVSSLFDRNVYFELYLDLCLRIIINKYPLRNTNIIFWHFNKLNIVFLQISLKLRKHYHIFFIY